MPLKLPCQKFPPGRAVITFCTVSITRSLLVFQLFISVSGNEGGCPRFDALGYNLKIN